MALRSCYYPMPITVCGACGTIFMVEFLVATGIGSLKICGLASLVQRHHRGVDGLRILPVHTT